ncbi:2TM domain-containing protein [Cellulophaga sp. HaHaR_3_176]|uniref:2TM domain-containing protein n=1 Tax=Cellulophaga sp. HaHaR_3_176 TaxID=1942464 RepID=UPI001C1FF7CC|nr:2TM domain-containing protein [Cellulophaga sp. HaHaR_3_176]QWX85559.1 2TM domain-containing protein [Cellulophaga sp. HaHaR_3_176]
MSNTDNDSKYFRAKERVAAVKVFYGKVFKYILAIVITGSINYYLNEWSNPWFLWVVLGVSISLILKAVKLFGYEIFMGKNWEQRKIEELMRDDDTKKKWN